MQAQLRKRRYKPQSTHTFREITKHCRGASTSVEREAMYVQTWGGQGDQRLGCKENQANIIVKQHTQRTLCTFSLSNAASISSMM